VTRLDMEVADYEAAVAKFRSAKRSVAVPSRPGSDWARYYWWLSPNANRGAEALRD